MENGYERLEVYKRAMELSLVIHRISLDFPKHELHELGSQVRRSSKSIATNIAEGYGRKYYEKDFRKFLINALASTDETKVHLDYACKLDYISKEIFENLEKQYQILGRQLSAFIKTF
ncbi:MAG: four helix bundle protein [Actinobacteria bacterium]|nr:four helix bundle protein [Actinomycetota bacterium]